MADDYNLLNNFMDELRKTINEENDREPRSFNAQEFIAHLVSQSNMDNDHEILGRIANWKDVPAEFRKELVSEILSHVGVAFLFAGDDR